MTFSIQAAGRIPDVIEQIKAHEFHGDASQAEAVRSLLLAQLEAWNPDGHYKGVFVEASGHHDASSRNLNLTLRPVYIREPKPEAESNG